MGLFSVKIKLPSRIWWLVIVGGGVLCVASLPLACAIRSIR